MKTTYLVENAQNQVIGYYTQLCEAKSFLEKNEPSGKITCLKGNYFGEGFHLYYLNYSGKKYNRTKN